MNCIQHPDSLVNKLYSARTHGIVSLPLSIFGVILNMIVISIFVQKPMRNRTNTILIGISLFDLLMMLAYIPNSIYFYILHQYPFPDQFIFWPYFALIYHHFSVFAHACSVWLTCYLAFFRLITVAHCVLKKPNNKKILDQNVVNMMAFIVLFVIFLMISNLLVYTVTPSCMPFMCLIAQETKTVSELAKCSFNNGTNFSNLNSDSIGYFVESNFTSVSSELLSVQLKLDWLGASKFGTRYPILLSINLWIHSLMFRTLPCIIMFVFSVLLIYVMNIANKQKKKLQEKMQKQEHGSQSTDFNRTTTMLLIIVILFLIMEFPHGIIYLIGSFSTSSYYTIYDYFGDLLDLLVLINSSINFFLYCFMSSEFRKTFKQTYLIHNRFFKLLTSKRQPRSVEKVKLQPSTKNTNLINQEQVAMIK